MTSDFFGYFCSIDQKYKVFLFRCHLNVQSRIIHLLDLFFSSFASFRRYNFWTIKAQFVMKKMCKKGYCPYCWPFFNHFLRLDDNFEANALKGVLIIQKMYPRKRVKWQNSILGINSCKNGLIFLIFSNYS